MLLRYEAWAALATVGGLLLVEPAWRRWRGRPPEAARWRDWMAVALPVVVGCKESIAERARRKSL